VLCLESGGFDSFLFVLEEGAWRVMVDDSFQFDLFPMKIEPMVIILIKDDYSSNNQGLTLHMWGNLENDRPLSYVFYPYPSEYLYQLHSISDGPTSKDETGSRKRSLFKSPRQFVTACCTRRASV